MLSLIPKDINCLLSVTSMWQETPQSGGAFKFDIKMNRPRKATSTPIITPSLIDEHCENTGGENQGHHDILLINEATLSTSPLITWKQLNPQHHEHNYKSRLDEMNSNFYIYEAVASMISYYKACTKSTKEYEPKHHPCGQLQTLHPGTNQKLIVEGLGTSPAQRNSRKYISRWTS